MKLVRFTGLSVLVFALSSMVFFPGPPASGQTAPGQDVAPGVTEVPATIYAMQGNNGSYYAGSNFRFGGHDPATIKLLTEEAKLEREARGLVKEYARTLDEGQRDKSKEKLSQILGKQFDLQQKRRDIELARLEAQVKKLRDLMKKRSDARQTIVEKRLDQLIREADGLGWTAPPGPGLPNAADFVTPAPAQLR